MKKLLIIPALFLFEMAFSQSDTIFLRNSNQKLPVKIYEISEYEIRYRRTDLDESPLFVSDIENILKIKYKNGTSQVFTPDELTIPYDAQDIVKQREAFKFHVFDLPAGKIAFGYERVLRPGVNTDFKVGIFNSNLYSSFNSNYDGNMYNPYGARFGGGTFAKAGLKLLSGTAMHTKGMKYGHLLSGVYLRFDVYISYIQYQGIRYSVPDPNYVAPANSYTNYGAGTIQKTTDAKNYNYGFLICLGSQHVLANILTIDYYAGLGFNGSSYTFTQKDYGVNGPIINYTNNQYYYGYNRYANPNGSNVLAAQRLSNFMAGTIGFNIGFVYKRKTPPQSAK